MTVKKIEGIYNVFVTNYDVFTKVYAKVKFNCLKN